MESNAFMIAAYNWTLILATVSLVNHPQVFSE